MSQDFNGQLASIIRGELDRRHMTQASLAAQAGLAVSTLSEKLNSKRPFNARELDRIAQALGVSFSISTAREDLS
jgi:transcriptional regulator with XRE-family HTH domain